MYHVVSFEFMKPTPYRPTIFPPSQWPLNEFIGGNSAYLHQSNRRRQKESLLSIIIYFDCTLYAIIVRVSTRAYEHANG